MDEPFSALDIQTRQLMENQLLELWSANRKSVVFITHDLEEAISLSDRVVVLSAGPESHPIGEFAIDLPRPRDVAEDPADAALRRAAYADLARDEGRGAEELCPARTSSALRLVAARCCSPRCSLVVVCRRPARRCCRRSTSTIRTRRRSSSASRSRSFERIWDLVLHGLHLPAPVGDAARDAARLRHRHRARAGDGAVARAQRRPPRRCSIPTSRR